MDGDLGPKPTQDPATKRSLPRFESASDAQLEVFPAVIAVPFPLPTKSVPPVSQLLSSLLVSS
jgi:hypothetical protein